MRVETGRLTTNANDLNYSGRSEDYRDGWLPFRRPRGNGLIIGVKRRIQFEHAFQNRPRVIAALSVINLRNFEDVLRDLGFRADSAETNKLRYTSASVETEGEEADGFTLLVALFFPGRTGPYLAHVLDTLRIDPARVQEARNGENIDPQGSASVTPNDRWMLDFYYLLGTIDVAWMATAKEP